LTSDLSVIIPTFRRPVELVEAITRVLAEQQIRLEVIVVDDSPEGSARNAVASIADSRVRYLNSERPSGGKPALVRNQGWPHATGRFVQFLDDDDLPDVGAYTAMIGALEANSGKGVVFGRVEPFGNDPHELQLQEAYFNNATKRARFSNRFGLRWLITANMLFMDSLLVNSACMLRRECIEPLGGYDVDCELNEDADFYLRAIRRFGCVYLNRVVVHYRTCAPSLMHDRVGSDPLSRAYRHIHRKYRAEHGAIEYMSLKLFARAALRWL